jgi:hypothetical protein
VLESQREYTRPTPEFQYHVITGNSVPLARPNAASLAHPLQCPPVPCFSPSRPNPVDGSELSTRYSLLATRHSLPSPPHFNAGAMMSANEVRARLSRDFTVPRLQPVISAISS